MKHDVVIFDIDGTLANNAHRQHYLDSKDWNGFFEAMDEDEPIDSVCRLAQSMGFAPVKLVFCTGRPEKYRQVTLDWLKKRAEIFLLNENLMMRPDGDYRPDHEVKKEMLDKLRAEGYKVWFVVDDRNSVVDMWRKNGVTCLQCAEGDF